MSVTPSDIDYDYIIKSIEQIADALAKDDFLTFEERLQLREYTSYEKWRQCQYSSTNPMPFNHEADKHHKNRINYDPDISQSLKEKLWKAETEHIETTLEPLQKELDLYLAPRWFEILQHSMHGYELQQEIEALINYQDERCLRFVTDSDLSCPKKRIATKKIIRELERNKETLKYARQKQPKTKQTIESKRETTKPRKAKKIEKKVQPCTKSGGEKIEWSRPQGLNQWAIIFGIHPNTMSEWFKKQSVRNEQVSARRWRVDIDELPGDLVKKVRASSEDK